MLRGQFQSATKRNKHNCVAITSDLLEGRHSLVVGIKDGKEWILDAVFLASRGRAGEI